MSSTQFSMVEELASLVKDNLPSKHLILSVEELLINFLQDDTGLDGVLELEPMNPYNRLLVHRLADIFGFSHQSVGEGEARHLVLERYPETSMPSILVSDFLQFDEMQSPMIFEEPRWMEVMPGQRNNAVSKASFEERETSYFAARERIFSADASETKPVKERPKHDPVVARRMITHALGQSHKAMKYEPSLSGAKENARAATSERPQPKAAEQKEIKTRDENYLRKEHMGAAKRLFANALGMNASKR
ncbi:protein encore [Phtheirospermum japonicum]|uniref:Protein encore n=1 Tax=Phtheirospermum japonicum TaxID=374723 RepID=A0A830BTC7_9LAMI|nr:protein encore [Phtheirospermum japonicum]